MNLRSYQNEDYLQLRNTLHEAKLYYEPLGKREIWKKQIEHDPESIIIAEKDGKVVGGVFILYQPFFSTIWHLGVHPDYQRKGIGAKLMDKAEEVLKRRGIERIGVFVEKDNKTVLELAKKKGWVTFKEVIPLEKIL